MANRKLGKPSDQRVALLRNQTTALLWNGKVVTTEARAKEIRSIAEKIITLAVKEYDNSQTVEKESRNEKSQIIKHEVINDKSSKLAARRAIMAYVYDIPAPKEKKESKSEYAERTKERRHPVVEKLFRDIAPKYAKRAEAGSKGGYTRMFKLGPRRGDAAEMVVIALVD
jgi:large subunit ribosomal protein L17